MRLQRLVWAGALALPWPLLAGPSATSSAATAAYDLLDVVDPEALPASFQRLHPGRCATPLAVAAVEALEGADPLASGLLRRALARPNLEHSTVSPTGRFRLHYDTEGREAVDPADDDGNGVPDYIDLAAVLADSSWHVQTDVLGYREPPSDGDLGGGDEIDIYFLDLGRSERYGVTFPMTSSATGPSYLHIDNDFTNGIFGNTFICPGHRGTRGTDALRVTLAHEIFHVIQFGYYQGSDGSWWQEATATWMEDVIHPRQNDYLQYVCAFVLVPGRALDSGNPRADFHAYGAAIFPHFLDQRYGRDLIRATWEEHSARRNASLDNLDRAVRDYNDIVYDLRGLEAGIEGAFSDYAVWSWFVGDRFRDGFFAEGDLYPSNFVPPVPVIAHVATADSGRIDHMATRYLRFEPRLLPGGVTIDVDLARGRWRNRLLLVSPDSVDVVDVGDGSFSIVGWDAYDEIVLALSNVDVVGIGYNYQVTVEYDPELIDVEPPQATRLEGGWPNPFIPDLHQQALIPFELATASAVTRMSLFGVDGRLVQRYDLGPRSARRHFVRWDGTNETGSLVSSGIYYAVLEADGVARRAALAVVRRP
jgi:hypothetical protein